MTLYTTAVAYFERTDDTIGDLYTARILAEDGITCIQTNCMSDLLAATRAAGAQLVTPARFALVALSRRGR